MITKADAKIRDIPVSCLCPWHWDCELGRWVRDRTYWRCTWHGGKS